MYRRLSACLAAAQLACALREDSFVFLDNGVARLGIDTSKGGAIGWFGPSNTQTNFVNIHDWGREVQASFYSGPANYNPNGLCNAPGYDPFPWNPIGAGDFYQHSSIILNITKTNTTALVVSRPLLWPCNAVPCECTFTKTIQLMGNAAEVRVVLQNNRSDQTQYNAFNQELPAVYTIGALCNLWGAPTGAPFTGPLVQLPLQPQNNASATYLPERWIAYTGADGVGMGVWHDSIMTFGNMYYHPGTDCQGGAYNDTTGYTSPWTLEILDWNIRYAYNFSLVLGTASDVRAYAQSKAADAPSSADYVFVSDRQHFWYTNAADTWPVMGFLNVSMEQNDPQVIGPVDFINATAVPRLYIVASYSTTQHDTTAQIFFRPLGAPGFSADASVTFTVTADGQFHSYAVPMSGAPGWTAVVDQLRFDPVIAGMPGAYVLIKCISTLPSCTV